MDKQLVDKAIDVRQAMLADLDELPALFDDYRQFQKQPATSSSTCSTAFRLDKCGAQHRYLGAGQGWGGR